VLVCFNENVSARSFVVVVRFDGGGGGVFAPKTPPPPERESKNDFENCTLCCCRGFVLTNKIRRPFGILGGRTTPAPFWRFPALLFLEEDDVGPQRTTIITDTIIDGNIFN
jgi:hypothetical protein